MCVCVCLLVHLCADPPVQRVVLVSRKDFHSDVPDEDYYGYRSLRWGSDEEFIGEDEEDEVEDLDSDYGSDWPSYSWSSDLSDGSSVSSEEMVVLSSEVPLR